MGFLILPAQFPSPDRSLDMSLVTREMAAQAHGQAQKHSQLTTKPSNEHLSQHRGGNQQLMQRNGPDRSSIDNAGIQTSPPTSLSAPSQHPGGGDKAVNGLADFFSQEVFHIVLHNPTTAHRLLKFSQARMCGENMEFLEKVRSPVSFAA